MWWYAVAADDDTAQLCQFTSKTRACDTQCRLIVFIHPLQPKGFSQLKFLVYWTQFFCDILIEVVEMG
jgi:hypothetical protein